jgi:hypothetical protein
LSPEKGSKKLEKWLFVKFWSLDKIAAQLAKPIASFD